MVQALDLKVHQIEATPGLLNDWSLPGELPSAAAFDVARTVCRRAERLAVRLHETAGLEPQILAYLNRLSDLLWLMGRALELKAGVNAALRSKDHPGNRWSRAW
jgi:cob(I)alamin adenosyltransferase